MRLLFISVVCSFVLTSCSPKVHMTRLTDEEFPPAMSMEVFQSEPTHLNFLPIADLAVSGRLADAIEHFLNAAAPLGANAVILKGKKTTWEVFEFDEGRPQRDSVTRHLATAIRLDDSLPRVEKNEKVRATPIHDAFYAVVETEKQYQGPNWSTTTNFMLVTQTPSKEACQAEVARGNVGGQKFSDCVAAGGWYDKLFKHEPTGDWYVTVRLKDAYPAAAILRPGKKLSAAGAELDWTYHDEYLLAQSVADGMMKQAQTHNLVPTIHIFSPEKEI